MAIDYRNQTIARVAFAVAQSDGAVQREERDALLKYLEAHPESFSEDDTADILSYFDDFAFQLGRPVLDDWRMRALPMYLYSQDAEPVLSLLTSIAESFEGIVPAERALLERIRQHVVEGRKPEA